MSVGAELITRTTSFSKMNQSSLPIQHKVYGTKSQVQLINFPFRLNNGLVCGLQDILKGAERAPLNFKQIHWSDVRRSSHLTPISM